MHRIFYFLLTLFFVSPTLLADSPAYHLYVDRAQRQLYVLNPEGTVMWQAPCGIGRGGRRVKKSMADEVTPTGEFVVDIILDHTPELNQSLRATPVGLAQLFRNMDGIDFNGDGRPDHAFGSAYIGLDSKTAITGPKLKPYRDGTLYWFSIALHGTPDPANIGKANSGGCVHLGADSLAHLIEGGIVRIGTRVTIADVPPH